MRLLQLVCAGLFLSLGAGVAVSATEETSSMLRTSTTTATTMNNNNELNMEDQQRRQTWDVFGFLLMSTLLLYSSYSKNSSSGTRELNSIYVSIDLSFFVWIIMDG